MTMRRSLNSNSEMGIALQLSTRVAPLCRFSVRHHWRPPSSLAVSDGSFSVPVGGAPPSALSSSTFLPPNASGGHRISTKNYPHSEGLPHAMGERTWQRQRLSTRATGMLLLRLPYRIHRLPAVFLGPRKGEVTRFVHAAMPTLDLFKRGLIGMRAVIRSAKSALRKGSSSHMRTSLRKLSSSRV